MKKFYIQNFGCRATQADGAALSSALTASGYTVAGHCAEADLVILNTCTVTSSADEDVRQAVRRVRRGNPSAQILMTGCYAQRAPEEAASLPGVRWVVGNTHKELVPEILKTDGQRIFVGDIFAQQQFSADPVLEAGEDRTRPNLKIQDGCNNRCTFCIIPFVRGNSRSAHPDRILDQVRDLSRALPRGGAERGEPGALGARAGHSHAAG